MPISASSNTCVAKRSVSCSTTVSVTRPRPSGVDSQTTRAPFAGQSGASSSRRAKPSTKLGQRSTSLHRASVSGGVSRTIAPGPRGPHLPYTSRTMSSIDDFTESRNGRTSSTSRAYSARPSSVSE